MKLLNIQESFTIMPAMSGSDTFWHSEPGYNREKHASLGSGIEIS